MSDRHGKSLPRRRLPLPVGIRPRSLSTDPSLLFASLLHDAFSSRNIGHRATHDPGARQLLTIVGNTLTLATNPRLHICPHPESFSPDRKLIRWD